MSQKGSSKTSQGKKEKTLKNIKLGEKKHEKPQSQGDISIRIQAYISYDKNVYLNEMCAV